MSRSTTQKFIVGQFRDKIPQDKLPTEKDVLKYLFYQKYEESKSKKIPEKQDVVCCLLDRETHQAKCESTILCTADSPCVVRAVKDPWIKAGFPVIQDRQIKAKILR